MKFLLPSHHLADRNAGAAGADAHLAEALRKRGHSADLLFLDDVVSRRLCETRWASVLFPWLIARRLLRRGEAATFDVIESTAGDLWVADVLLSASIRASHPLLAVRTHGLEHLHAEHARIMARQAGERLSLRYRTYHGGFRLFEVRRDLKRSALVIVHNVEDKRYAVERLHIEEAKIHVVHLGIDERFLQDASEPSDERAGVLFVGEWLPRKGIDLLPGIFERILAPTPTAPLTLAGVRQPVEKVLTSFSPTVAQRLTVLPVVPHGDLPALMSRHSVFVFPSKCEGFGLVLIEAMARGMIVVSSPAGVAPEVIRSGWNGFIVDDYVAESFADAVSSVLQRGGEFSAVRENARATARQFTWDRAAEAREYLYGNLIAGARAR